MLSANFYNVESRVKVPTLLLAMMFLSCTAAYTAPQKPWRIEVATSGGLTGRGNGTYAIDSTGKVTATLINGKSCSYQADAAELSRIEQLLGETKRGAWKAEYIPENPCCDRIEYTLTVDEAGALTTTKWIDDPPPMPRDLVALGDAFLIGETSIRAQSAERCQ